MNIFGIERGSVLIFTGAEIDREAVQELSALTGCAVFQFPENEIGVVDPEPVNIEMDQSGFGILDVMAQAAERANIDAHSPIPLNDDFEIMANKLYAFHPEWLKSRLPHVFEAVKGTVEDQCDEYRDAGKKIDERLSGVIQATGKSFKAGGRYVEIRGVAQVSGLSIDAVNMLLKGVMKVDAFAEISGHVSFSGSLIDQETSNFEEAMTDFKRRNDAIARATSDKSIPQRAADAVGVTPYSDCRVHVEQAVQWALDNDDRKYTIGDATMKRVFEPNGMVNLADLQAFLDAVEAALQPSPIAEPEPVPHEHIANLHEQAIEAHKAAETHAIGLEAIPESFKTKSNAVEIMVSEYFELAKIAADLSERAGLKVNGIPEGTEKIWHERSLWHFHARERHRMIYRNLTNK